jgi:succinoglycan biosynthesis transport protein ExoP
LSHVPARPPVEAREYIDVLRRQRWVILLVTVAITGFTLLFSLLQDSVYKATATVLVAPLPPPNVSAVASNIGTESELVSSRLVADAVRTDLGTDESTEELLDDVSVAPVTGTDVLEITYSSHDPEIAQSVANSFAENYIEYRQARIIDALKDAQQLIRRRLRGLQERLEALDEALLRARRQRDEDRVEVLRDERNSLIVQRGLTQQRLADLQPEGTARLLEGDIVEPAELPSGRASPDHKRNLVLGLLLGAIVGLAAGFTRDYLGSPRAE